MNASTVCGPVVAALLAYVSSRHQSLSALTLWRSRAAAWPLRVGAAAVFCASVVGAAPASGIWPALFQSLCMLMLACMLLPLFDAWRRSLRHVD